MSIVITVPKSDDTSVTDSKSVPKLDDTSETVSKSVTDSTSGTVSKSVTGPTSGTGTKKKGKGKNRKNQNIRLKKKVRELIEIQTIDRLKADARAKALNKLREDYKERLKSFLDEIEVIPIF